MGNKGIERLILMKNCYFCKKSYTFFSTFSRFYRIVGVTRQMHNGYNKQRHNQQMPTRRQDGFPHCGTNLPTDGLHTRFQDFMR